MAGAPERHPDGADGVTFALLFEAIGRDRGARKQLGCLSDRLCPGDVSVILARFPAGDCLCE
jgi:hypothetical protein